MEKKLQVFVSSTFIDLQEERQAAVESILNAGHIPAGMELFKAGDESQKETIKRWIEESDVYMLILGGRYGSIEEDTGKSYTHWEYDYAGELGKPRFAMVIKEEFLDKKVREFGVDVTERDNYQKYLDFKGEVLGKISKFFSDIKDIKLTVLESLKEFERDSTLAGWVSGKEIESSQDILKRNFQLLEENRELKVEIESLNKKLKDKERYKIGSHTYEEVLNYLKATKITIPSELLSENKKDNKMSLLVCFLSFRDAFNTGIENRQDMDIGQQFGFFKLAPKLMPFKLLEKTKVASKTYQRIQISEIGLNFLALYDLENNSKKPI